MEESSLDKRRRALEESYFEKRNKEALENLAKALHKNEKICPLTGEKLDQRVLHGVIVYGCPEGKGMWIEGDQLEKLFNEIESEESKEAGVHWDLAFFAELAKEAKTDTPHGALKVKREDEGERKSPATGKPMVKFEVDGIILDRCEETGGIWFDGSELEMLIEKVKHTTSLEELTSPHWVRTLFKAIGYK